MQWPSELFPPLMSNEIPRSESLRVAKNDFGGGYSQVADRSLNPTIAEVSFEVYTNENDELRTLAVLRELLKQAKGTEPFQHAFPGEPQRNWRVTRWQIRAKSPTQHIATIEAELWNEPQNLLGTPIGGYRLTYTPSWSAISSSIAPPTYADLQDGPYTGFAIAGFSAQWLRATLPATRVITHIGIQAGSVTGFGNTAGLLNGANIQISADGSTWTDIYQSIAGITDSDDVTFLVITPNAVTSNVRILGAAGGLAFTRFEVWGY